MSGEIKEAEPQDHHILTHLTRLSKAYWGYSNDQLLMWSEDLRINNTYIETNNVYKLILCDEVIGYYSYINESEGLVILDNMFILPRYIGKGFGKHLMIDFLNRMNKTDVKKIKLFSEPKAEDFYQKFGFISIEYKESSIKGRFLPTMELTF